MTTYDFMKQRAEAAEARVAELEAALKYEREYVGPSKDHTCESWRMLAQERAGAISRLEAQNARLRAALEVELAENQTLKFSTPTGAFVIFATKQKWRLKAALNGEEAPTFDLVAHLRRQMDFSLRTFGPGTRTKGVIDHIRKELAEIEAEPNDLTEWIDVVLLALDGAWRHGGTPETIMAALQAKQTKNESRTWPDWRTAPQDKAICHEKLNGEETST